MTELEQRLKKRIETGDLELPVLPAVGTQVLELTENAESDAKDLAKLIQSDQSLASHVMKVANSAAFNSVGQIQTLQQAVAKIGMRQIAQMALAVSVGQSVFTADSSTENILQYLWKHSLSCAAWGREIARIGRINTEVVFLCGLLHQIGKPVALNALQKLSDNEPMPDKNDLLVLLDKYHKVVGVNLARRWSLPEAIVESINFIDDFYAAPTAREEVMAVHAARAITDLTMREGGYQTEDFLSLSEPVFSELNLYEEDMQELAGKAKNVEALLQSMVI